MSDDKKCALIRQTWYETARAHMSDMARLAFYEACFNYEFTGEVPTVNTCKHGDVLMMFDMVKDTLKADIEKAERIAERNRINGRLGGRPKQPAASEPKNTTEDNKPLETQNNPMGTQNNPVANLGSPLHNTTQHHTTNAASSMERSGVFDSNFFEAQLWPRLNASKRWNTRHRKCLEAWATYSDRKRQAIVKAVLTDAFAGADNPYYYLEDFAEPHPPYLTGAQCEYEWKRGRNVIQIMVEGKWMYVTEKDAAEWGINGKIMPPMD